MSLGSVLLLLGAGIGAGVAGSTAGLASLCSYPALLAVGLPPVTANVTNTVALIGSSIGSVTGSRRELGTERAAIRQWVPWALVGGVCGAVLLLLLPGRSFEVVVPYLVAGSATLLWFSPRIRDWARHRGRHGGPLGIGLAVFAIGIYGGYFGAAAGVMILAVLLAATDRLMPTANALKNVLLGVANGVAAVLFAVIAPVSWWSVLPLAIGCLVGGRLGPSLVRTVPATVIRAVVSLGGLALAVRLWIG